MNAIYDDPIMVRDPCNLHTKEPFPQSHAGEQYTVSSRRSLSLSDDFISGKSLFGMTKQAALPKGPGGCQSTDMSGYVERDQGHIILHPSMASSKQFLSGVG